ncbi:5-oxoprolinase subunit PxpB [Wielerella bovis]|uniref:5-oxoprolinase subunit PxpB n=1 Tax=Wielerella bovis TaxID=2917790 RepID=UPI003211EC98
MMIEINNISENALCCTLPPPAELSKQQRWWAFADSLQALPEIAEVVVGMNNVTAFTHYGTDLITLSGSLKEIWERTQAGHHQGRHVDIPVVYGGEFGEDLAEVAAFHGITTAEVIARHTAPTYTVFMMGFQPGFPYLGGLPENLHTPRRAVPRASVPAGSVGIGGAQTGMYPFASPGGWQIIGRTFAPLFQAAAMPPTLLNAGDTVRFVVERIEK